MFTSNDHYFMGYAMQLAARGRCTTMPNPAVGCVIVRDDRIIGEGWHQFAGKPHAEINALDSIVGDAQGATVYVTLEPCCHDGRTPPCTSALLNAGVKRVVAAMKDPNPEVAGKGLEILKQAGIETFHGLMQTQAEQLNRGFNHRMRHGWPFVTAKMAMSMDGRTAMASGESKWITSPQARQDVQALRRCSDAIMTGHGTVETDDPQMTVRGEQDEPAGRQPLRVILDSGLRTSPDAKILQGNGRKIIFTNDEPHDTSRYSQCNDVSFVAAGDSHGKVDLGKVLQELARLEINNVLLECGAGLAGAMLQAGFINELVVYMAPKLMGNTARALFNLPGIDKMHDSINVNITDIRAVGEDWRITAIAQSK